jgi:hypothetical protein
MDNTDEKKIAIALPGEWALKKVLGPTLDTLGSDINKVYQVGRDKIIDSAKRKIKNIEDGSSANLRVSRDVFWNGSFTDEAICAEYFGGILASSRSQDGKDDTGVFFVDIIKSLSSGQLKMHYLIYRSLNKILIVDKTKEKMNPGQETELQREQIFFPSLGGVIEQFEKDDMGAILHGLHSKGLIGVFQTDNHVLEETKTLPYIKVAPTTLGVQLFAIANNMFDKWREYSTFDFGDFDSVNLPRVYAQSIDSILEKLNLKKKEENTIK